MKYAKKTAAVKLAAAVLIFLSGCVSFRTGRQETIPVRGQEGESINGIFPEAVYIKTRTQTFNTYHYYILQDGLIWYKSIDGKKKPFDWTLFQKTGLPHNFWHIGFNKPKKIVEISADADELVALSDEGGFYRFCFDIVIAHKSDVWLDRQGWPVEEQLFLDERTAKNRAWAFGKRNSHVLYYEDSFGNQHHNGTMEIATTYILLEDGQEICYADTGLRSDYSRNYIGPERGAFKAIALSVSASTMFVMNDAGEMYTRIADFDIIGCDPMWFKYTYIPYKSDLPGTNFLSNLTEWGLPSEDWRAQPRVPLAGKAALTRHITILQNGQGNGARELRIAGLNEAGETGYWTKGIFDDFWDFKKVPLYFPPDAFLKNTEGAGERGETLDAAFRGFWWNNGEKENETEYAIPNFNILEGDCELHITRRGETCRLTLYPVELWTYQKRNFLPGRTGMPKLFFVTFSFEESALADLSDDFAGFIRRKFGKQNKALFHYTLTAGNDFFLLQDGKNADSVLFLTNGTIADSFPEFQNAWYLPYANEIARYNAPELGGENKIFTAAELRAKIEQNKILRKRLTAEIGDLKQLKLLAFGINLSYLPLDGIARFSLLRFVDLPKIRTMIRFGRKIVLTNSAYINRLSDMQIWVNQKLVDLLDARLACYSDLARQLSGETEPVSLPPWFSEHITDFWDIAGLPHSIDGAFFSPNSSAQPRIPAVLNFTPVDNKTQAFGWYLTVGESPSFTIFIDPQKSAKAIYRRKGKTPAERPVSIGCTLHINPVVKTHLEQDIIEKSLAPFIREDHSGIDARILFNGEDFEIREYTEDGGNRAIFRGKAVPPVTALSVAEGPKEEINH
jgi:hypothetical protein